MIETGNRIPKKEFATVSVQELEDRDDPSLPQLLPHAATSSLDSRNANGEVDIVARMCYAFIMTTRTAMVRARIEPGLKRNAERVLDRVGLDSSEAIRLYFRAIVNEKGIPFPVRVPNAETRKALRDIRAGRNVKTAKSPDEFYKAVGLD